MQSVIMEQALDWFIIKKTLRCPPFLPISIWGELSLFEDVFACVTWYKSTPPCQPDGVVVKINNQKYLYKLENYPAIPQYWAT